MSYDSSRLFTQLETAFRRGTATLVLGPSTSQGSVSKINQRVPSLSQFKEILGRDQGLAQSEIDQAPFDDILALYAGDPGQAPVLATIAKEHFTVERPSRALYEVTSLVWHRIYTFDPSDALEVAYRTNPARSQRYEVRRVREPLTILSDISQSVELIKLGGDIQRLSIGSLATTPHYLQTAADSIWFQSLSHDFGTRMIVLAGEAPDRDLLLQEYRRLRATTKSHSTIYLVIPALTALQQRTIGFEQTLHIPVGFAEFMGLVKKRFAAGITIDDVVRTTNPALALIPANVSIDPSLSDLHFLNRSRLMIPTESIEPAGSIRRFYRGDDVVWSDIREDIHADLTSYRNFRGRILTELEKSFPARTVFVLLGPAGYGKTVGLMATALWLSDQTPLPVAYVRPDANLRAVLRGLGASTVFESGVYLIVDDIALFADALSELPEKVANKICIVAASRDTRFEKHAKRFLTQFRIVQEPIRPLNFHDASALHEKISRYGTLIHLETKERPAQIQEIIRRSGKDLLVLIKELGLGRRFDEMILSEVSDLSAEERFAYFLVCIPYRSQVPIPLDLLSLALRERYPGTTLGVVLEKITRLIVVQGRSARARHAVIAARLLELGSNRDVVQAAITALLSAFSKFQTPILVHHSNTGHARVYKTVITHKFIAKCLSNEQAIDIYRQFEKAFENDGFFWQQLGLAYLQAGDYALALETLSHAVRIHDHHYIRHSLAVAKLKTCRHRPSDMSDDEFVRIRSEGISELERLHNEIHFDEDLAIATLVQHDLAISQKYDSKIAFEEKRQRYHALLAFYCRSHPNMTQARQEYERLSEQMSQSATRIIAEDPDVPDYWPEGSL